MRRSKTARRTFAFVCRRAERAGGDAMPHEHLWGPDDDCDAALMLGGRVVACAARRCAAPECQEKRDPPGDYCKAHLYLGRCLRLPTRATNA